MNGKRVGQASQNYLFGLFWLLLVACISPALAQSEVSDPVAPATAKFWLDARLSVKVVRYDQSPQQASGQLLWLHDDAYDRLRLLSPFGQTLAELIRQFNVVEARLSDGRVVQAATLSELVQQSVGFALPFDTLADWLTGTVGETSTQVTVVHDAYQRPVFLQDGVWQVRYEYSTSSAWPSSLAIESEDGVSLRLRVNRWVHGEEVTDELMP